MGVVGVSLTGKPHGVRDAKGQGVDVSITLCVHGNRTCVGTDWALLFRASLV